MINIQDQEGLICFSMFVMKSYNFRIIIVLPVMNLEIFRT